MSCWRSYSRGDSQFFNTFKCSGEAQIPFWRPDQASSLYFICWRATETRGAGNQSYLTSAINSFTKCTKEAFWLDSDEQKSEITHDKSVTDEPVTDPEMPRDGWGTLSPRLLSDLRWLLLSISRLFGGQTGENHNITLKMLLFMLYFFEHSKAKQNICTFDNI